MLPVALGRQVQDSAVSGEWPIIIIFLLNSLNSNKPVHDARDPDETETSASHVTLKAATRRTLELSILRAIN